MGAVSDLNRVINKSASMPILTGIHASMDNAGRLTLRAMDGSDYVMTKTIQVDRWEGAGAFVADAEQLTKALTGMPEQDITLSVTNNRCEIAYKGGSLSFETGDVERYPAVNEAEYTDTANVDGQILTEGISRCLYAVAKDQIRPQMTGVYIHYADGQMSFAASDGRKLSISDRKADLACGAFEGILNPKTCNIIKATINAGKQVRLRIGDAYISLEYGNTMFRARLIEGRAPNYRGVIPTTTAYHLTINTKTLLASVKRLSAFAPSGSGLIRLDYDGNSTLALTAKDIDLFSRTMTEALSVDDATATEGDVPSLAIGLSATYLAQVLANFGSDKVTLNFCAMSNGECDASRPVTFTGDMATTILMPMLLEKEEEEPQQEDEPLPDDDMDEPARDDGGVEAAVAARNEAVAAKRERIYASEEEEENEQETELNELDAALAAGPDNGELAA